MCHFLSSDDQYFRKSDQLLIQFQWANKGQKITIARWIKMAISTRYRLKNKPPQALLRAHSTRAVATSWAESGHTSIEQICKASHFYSGSLEWYVGVLLLILSPLLTGKVRGTPFFYFVSSKLFPVPGRWGYPPDDNAIVEVSGKSNYR